MFRKILALLLLPCMLISQSAVFGHAHGGSEPTGHGLRPHLHAAGTSRGHGHPHQAAGGHRHHSHGHHSHEHGHHHHDDEGQHSTTGSPPVTPSEHDSDAVYIHCVDAVAVSRVAVELEFPVLMGWVFNSTSPADVLAFAVSSEAGRWANAPPLRGPACPLYLRQLTLLI